MARRGDGWMMMVMMIVIMIVQVLVMDKLIIALGRCGLETDWGCGCYQAVVMVVVVESIIVAGGYGL